MAGLFEISYDNLEFYELCDGGNYGCVYRGLWKSQSRVVAVKKVLTLDKEAEVLSRLSHRNVICFFGSVTAGPNICLVMEYAENGSLYAFLARDRSNMLPFDHILRWAGQIALGMNYLHNEAPVKVIHRDLKSKNVVISKDMVCKICDFGASRFAASTTKMSLVGTYAWMAPEVIQSFPVSDACDVWSYGVVLWELLTHEVPFKGIEGFQIAWMVVENGKRLAIPSCCPETFRSLMEDCWIVAPKDRPSFHEILKNIEQMQNDDQLSILTNSYLKNRSVWMTEIEASLEELKTLERNLGLRKEELHHREKELKEREKNLEKQFHVVQLESHDVNAWREVDVFYWIMYQLSERRNKGDLGQYADLFRRNDINGRRLLMLSQDDLRAMGVASQGHVIELHKEIQILKSHNHRLLHFPPLEVSPRPRSVTHSPSSREVRLIASCISPPPTTPQEMPKWKMLLDIYYGNLRPEEDDVNLIKHVTFAAKAIPNHFYKVSNYPFYMDRWASGLVSNMVIECTVTFENYVKSPRSVRFDHTIDGSNGRLTEKTVTLAVTPEEHIIQANQSRHQLVHSKSSPMLLKGAWSTRNLENAVPPIDTQDHQESVWSDVVANKIPGQYPAYRPQFSPIPQVFSRSSSFRSTSSGSPVQVSGSSSSSYCLSPSISSTEPSPQVEAGQRIDWQLNHHGGYSRQTSGLAAPGGPTTMLRLSQTEVSLVRGLSQIMTPESVGTSFSKPEGQVRFSIEDDENEKTIEAVQENHLKRYSLPLEQKNPLTIATIVNNFIGSDFARRSTSPVLLSNHSSDNDVDSTKLVRTGSLRQGASNGTIKGLSYEQHITENLSRLESSFSPKKPAIHDRRNDEVFPQRRPKKGKRKSMPRQTTMDSMTVHGGNSKWMWKS